MLLLFRLLEVKFGERPRRAFYWCRHSFDDGVITCCLGEQEGTTVVVNRFWEHCENEMTVPLHTRVMLAIRPS